MPSEEKSKKRLLVYFIVPAPAGISPGQRFRFEHYLGYLQEQGARVKLSSFYSAKGWKVLYTPGNKLRKVGVVARGFLRRIADLFRVTGYQYVYLYREAAPLGPPFFEWVLAKLLRKKIIYDFDDAIWIPVTSEYNKAASGLRNFSKVGKICSWSYKVSVGNDYLGQYAGKYNRNVVRIPTVVDTEKVHNRMQEQETPSPAIGWTGTFSTLPYLDIVLPVLQRLQEKYPFTFYVIADKDPQLPLRHYRFIQWTREKEVEDLLNFHIGIMPLYDNEIARGKCGFKAIQYMSLGIPAVVSPVGVNSIIVQDGVNGSVCKDDQDWMESLEKLLTSNALRERQGKEARKKIEDVYSVKATREIFLNLFN